MFKVGIDFIGFYTPNYFVDLSELALAREEKKDKYLKTYGQIEMSVPSIDEDAVSMSVNAATIALKYVNKKDIAFLLVATESSVDASKSVAMFVHGMLGLPASCRCLELKQACYSGTGGLMLAIGFLMKNPDKKVLLITSDIAQYKLNSEAESSGGAASIAMVLSCNPRLVEIEPHSGVYAEDRMDFWRPNYMNEPLINGRLSCSLYIKFLLITFQEYTNQSGISLNEIDHFCYHLSVPKLIENSHKHLYIKITGEDLSSNKLNHHIGAGSIYGTRIGNSYTTSLYLSLLSLLDNSVDLSGKRIGFYSYGSGSIGEFFTGKIIAGYEQLLTSEYNLELINGRKKLSIDDYEALCRYRYPKEANIELPLMNKIGARLSRIKEHARIYEYID